MAENDWIKNKKLLDPDGPVCLMIKATLKPVGDLDRFQPAGFPEIGHVIYDAPRCNDRVEKVCIVDSPASMANHLETVCTQGTGGIELHRELAGLPYVVCKTERARLENGQVVVESREPEVAVTTTLTEGHRLASDYFVHPTDKPTILGGELNGQCFREVLSRSFGIVEVPKKKGSTFFVPPETWWRIYATIFRYDPNSLVHGVMFAKEQIKITRFLTAHLEAFGASRVGRSGVKFDRLGKTISGQPIFAVDEETARKIRATFLLDLAMLRSYGRNGQGLTDAEKRLLLDLALWKIRQLLDRPFRYRTQCFLESEDVTLCTEAKEALDKNLPVVDIAASIAACEFGDNAVTDLYYPADKLLKAGEETLGETDEEEGGEAEEPEEGEGV